MGFFGGSSPNLESLKGDLQDQTRRVRELLDRIAAIEKQVTGSLREVAERLDHQERATRLMAEEMEERIDRGNKIWRKIRSAEYYEAQRQDREDESDPNFELFSPDGNGGGEEGVQHVPARVGWPGRAPTKAQEVGKALARRIAGIE